MQNEAIISEINRKIEEITILLGKIDKIDTEEPSKIESVLKDKLLLRKGETLRLAPNINNSIIYEWYDSENNLIHTGSYLNLTGQEIGSNKLSIKQEDISTTIDYEVSDKYPDVDNSEIFELKINFDGVDGIASVFEETQPFNTMRFPKNTIVNGIKPVLDGYYFTPQLQSVFMDGNKVITFKAQSR